MSNFNINYRFNLSDNLTRPMRNMGRKAVNSTKSMRGLGNAANAAGRNMRNMGNAAGTSGKNLRKIGNDATFAERRLHRLARRMRNMQTIRLGMGGALTGLGAGLVTRRIGSTLIDYEKAMNKVLSFSAASKDKDTGAIILKGYENAKKPIQESTRALKAMRDETQRVAQVSIFDPTQVAGGLLELAKSGLSAQDSTSMLHPVMRLAGASDLSPKRATDIATNITKAFGKDIKSAADTVDLLAMAASNANVDVSELGESMKYAAPSAMVGGRSLEETTGLMMSLAQRGYKGSIAGTTIARMLESIYKRSGPAVKALKSVGLAHKDFMGEDGNTIPVADMLDKFKEAAKVVGREKVIMAIGAMQGSRGGRGSKLLFETASDEIRANEKLLKLAKGRAKLMEDLMMSGVYGAYERMRASIVTSIIKLGEGGLSADIEYLADKVRSLANNFSQLNPSTKKWIGRLLLLATAISAVVIPLGIFIWAMGALIPFFALLVSPVGLVTAGVIALGTALTSVFSKYWDGSELQSLFRALGEQVGTIASSILNFAVSDNPIANIFRTALDYAMKLVGVVAKIPSYIMNPSKALKDFAKFNHDTAQGIGDKAASFTKKVGSWLPDLSVSKSAKEVVTGKTIAKTQADKEMSWVPNFKMPDLSVSKDRRDLLSGNSLAQSQVDKELALRVETENRVKVDAPGSITLKLPNGMIAGTIPLTTSSDKGRTQVDSAATP